MHEEPTEPGQAVRINKFLSLAGLGSRRKTEELVRQGRVQIDGETVVDLSSRVEQDQTVRVDGKVVHASRRSVVFALNKPVRVLVSEADPEGRPLAIDLVRHLYSGRLFSVGRLDFLSSGLLLFTNDGDLAQALMHPRTAIEREYVVETSEPVSDEVLAAFRAGVTIEGVRYRIARYQRHSARRVALTLEEGKNREIRRLFANFRLNVQRIYRNRYGPITLGRLPSGEARPLTPNEVERLRKATETRRPSSTSPHRPSSAPTRPSSPRPHRQSSSAPKRPSSTGRERSPSKAPQRPSSRPPRRGGDSDRGRGR
jgi:23S rRNA pseudouridine2605 synthase